MQIHRRWNSTLCANCLKKWWQHTLEEKNSSGQCQWIDYGVICNRNLPCPIHGFDRIEHPFGFTVHKDNEFEELRRERGWPTPNHMRKAADALDMLVYPKYGDILRWVADQCDGKE